MFARRRCGSRRARLLGPLLAVSLAAPLALGLASSWAHPTGSSGSAPRQKPHCYPQSPGPVEGSQSDPAQPLCGSTKGDKLVSRYGHNVESFGGDDTICAINGFADDIWGGPEGAEGDRAYVDAEDVKGATSLAAWGRKHDIEIVTRKPTAWTKKACPRRGGYAAAPQRVERRSAEPLRGKAFGPIVFCDVIPGTTDKWRIWFPHEPHITAADLGSGTQWQTVAWSAVLYRLENTLWTERTQTIWLWDRAFEDEARKPFIGHFWRQFAARRDRRFVYFTPSEPGTYMVEIKYHWYKEGRAPNYEFQVGDDDHVGPNETDGNHDSCTFPKVAPPPPPPPAGSRATGNAATAAVDLFGADLESLRAALPAPKLKRATR
jgi:hypothetical protein